MKAVKALVIQHEESTRQAIDDILSTLRHSYDLATSLAEARKAMTVNGYSYLLLDYEIPARTGGQPRLQNSENFLDELAVLKGHDMPPVILVANRMPDVDDEDKYRWASDMKVRGVTTFVCRPFRTAGRTLDRVIKKVLSGKAGMSEQEKTKTVASSCTAHDAPSEVATHVDTAPIGPDTEGIQTAHCMEHRKVALTKVQSEVLQALDGSSHSTMVQADIIAASGYGKHAVVESLKTLRDLGLVHRPHGPHGGESITDKGRQLLAGERNGV